MRALAPVQGASMSLNLTYRKVTKIFGEHGRNPVKALDEVSFTINPGELFCLLGPSGCGKTTLLRCTAGLEKITSGQILYGDRDMSIIPPFRRNIGMVFQSFALYPHMNIFENVAYGLRVRKLPEEEVKRRVTEVMELVGLTDELKRNPSPSALSGGQQQRVAIARALVYDPDILLLDEPLANLDAKLRRYMRAEIRRIQKATQITAIFVTHDQEEAMAIGDRLAVMRKGIVEQIGTSDEIYHRPDNAFVANFIGKMNFFHARLKTAVSAAPAAQAAFPSAPDTIEALVELEDGSQQLRISADRLHLPPSSAAGTRVLVGMRPEHLVVETARKPGSIPGQVNIIQHLGQVVRYEIKVNPRLSPQMLEIDMPGLVHGVKEGDPVFLTIKEHSASLYLPGEEHAE